VVVWGFKKLYTHVMLCSSVLFGVERCLSVWRSVCSSQSSDTSKQFNLSSELFHHLIAPTV